MLTGFLKYKEEFFPIHGYHLDQSLQLRISARSTKARLLLDEGLFDGEDTHHHPWEELGISIGVTNIAVETFAPNKDTTHYLNVALFKAIGSVVNGMLTGCTRDRSEEHMMLGGGEYNPKKSQKYIFDESAEGDNYCVLRMGELEELYFKGSYEYENFEIRLEDDKNTNFTPLPFLQKTKQIRLGASPYKQEEHHNVIVEGRFLTLDEIIERNPTKNYAWIAERNYIMVTRQTMKSFISALSKQKGLVGFDTETTGLNITLKSRSGSGDQLVGLVFSWEEGTAYYVPLRHKTFQNICEENEIAYVMEKVFKPLLESLKLLTHNGSFDWKVCHIYNINPNIVADTMILFKTSMWNTNRKMQMGLKWLTKSLLGRDSLELQDFVEGTWNASGLNFSDMDEKSTLWYACPDTDNLLGLWNWAMKQGFVEEYGNSKILEIEVLFTRVIGYQEFYGHCADLERADELENSLIKREAELRNSMYAIAGREFNPRSSQELQRIMFDELGYPVIKYTASGGRSTDSDTRKTLMRVKNEDGSPRYPFVVLLEEFSNVAKLQSNFLKKLPSLATNDGFMFSSVNQFLETGRVSISAPNYQSYDDTVKQYIVPRDGFYMLDFDYSAIEYRIIASVSGQENLVELFQDPDNDYHYFQASRIMGKPQELVTAGERQQIKGLNFGIPYGMSDSSLGETVYGKRSQENTRKAAKLRKKYFEGQDKVQGMFIKAQDTALTRGYAETYFGRRRYFDPRKYDKGSIKRQAGNHPIQGTAADVYKIAIGRIFLKLAEEGLLGKVLISAFVHDEAVIEVHKSLDPVRVLKLVRDAAMISIPGWCPLFIGAGFGSNWKQAKSTEIPVQVQDDIIERFGEIGLDWWNGDLEPFNEWLEVQILSYARDRFLGYIKDTRNYGTIPSSVALSYAKQVISAQTRGCELGIWSVSGVRLEDPAPDLMMAVAGEILGVSEQVSKMEFKRPDASQQGGGLEGTESTYDELLREFEDEYSDVEEDEVEDLAFIKKATIFGIAVKTSTKEVFLSLDGVNPRLISEQVAAELVKGTEDDSPKEYTLVYVYKSEVKGKYQEKISAKMQGSLQRLMVRLNSIPGVR